MPKPTLENLKFEEGLTKLEEMVDKLEEGELSLEDSIQMFEEGVALTKFLEKKLNEAQGKVEMIMKNSEGLTEVVKAHFTDGD